MMAGCAKMLIINLQCLGLRIHNSIRVILTASACRGYPDSWTTGCDLLPYCSQLLHYGVKVINMHTNNFYRLSETQMTVAHSAIFLGNLCNLRQLFWRYPSTGYLQSNGKKVFLRLFYETTRF